MRQPSKPPVKKVRKRDAHAWARAKVRESFVRALGMAAAEMQLWARLL